MPFTLLKPSGIDLSQTFAFTGTVTGAGGGKIGQVVHTKDTTYRNITTSSFVDCLSVTITPSATSSKILVLISSHFTKQNSNTNAIERAYRVVGGSDVATHVLSDMSGRTNDTSMSDIGFSATQWYDTPNTTSAITYDYRIASYGNSNGVAFNNYNAGGSYSSQITAMEILA